MPGVTAAYASPKRVFARDIVQPTSLPKGTCTMVCDVRRVPYLKLL
jgi:hypothetical protein